MLWTRQGGSATRRWNIRDEKGVELTMNHQHLQKEPQMELRSTTMSVKVKMLSWEEVEVSAWTGKGEVFFEREQRRMASGPRTGKEDVEEKVGAVVTKEVEERRTGSLKNEHDRPCSWRRNTLSARGNGME